MKIAILGFGREGQSLFRFLRKEPRFRTAEIWILDKNERIAIPRGARTQTGKNYLADIARFDAVFRSPGVPYGLPTLVAARRAGVRFSSATKLFFELAAPHRKKLIGITGTKGKGTTSALLAQILRRAGFRAILAGNIGTPMLDVLPDIRRADYVVLELSSFQLQDLHSSPHLATILDVFPDHLESILTAEHGTHRSLREYYDSKANVGRFQKKGDALFYFRNNRPARRLARKSPAKKISVVSRREGARKNYDMAAAIARFIGCDDALIRRTIDGFRGLEHRLEFVRAVKGVRFFNDSAATNPTAAAGAVRSFSEPLVLIAGGKDKGLDYGTLAKALARRTVKLVVLFGENKNKIRHAIRKSDVPVRLARNLKEAVCLAYRTARLLAHAPSYAAVVLSPGAASFDMFQNYADRGRKFKKLVKAL
ncbi:MAG: hypothetical protein A3A43_00720 [Candidatus Liptonbacteria bacterium RIFCSPLOWO2_01_FULL_56_20]|uniref:UDP-N-acetylmuramoylalanine--D-glutamate ligase n=1 Tax=Candidatus Liptonbacteria bacterium RIFCSPLOWO2_01_FULL_56_20 TaxID=1798652 RepID=A0A1G2CH29_9BACT|nr:MAG: hypothetical protein A3A43_00720 [Candidatus Liptonbacteria bacterium RIFCSPLOWO2_01_FULL_56_20]